jgi:hypothetical protein
MLGALILAAAPIATAQPFPFDSGSAGSSAPENPQLGQYAGTITWPGVTHQLVLNLTNNNPIVGTVTVVGVCQANWQETSRNGTNMQIRATVTSGACSNNTWNATFTPTTITGTQGPNSFTLRKL